MDTAFYVALIALFYELFKPVNRWISVMAAFFGLTGCAVQATGIVLQLFSLVLLNGGNLGTSDVTANQAFIFIKLNAQAASSALTFFAVYCLLIGYLILRSVFLPRVLGALMVLAGLGWLTFFYEPVAAHASPYVELLGIAAETALMLWLVLMGVNTQRWNEQAGSAG